GLEGGVVAGEGVARLTVLEQQGGRGGERVGAATVEAEGLFVGGARRGAQAACSLRAAEQRKGLGALGLGAAAARVGRAGEEGGGVLGGAGVEGEARSGDEGGRVLRARRQGGVDGGFVAVGADEG